MVRILAYEELSPRQRAGASALDWSDQDPPSLPERFFAARVDGAPFLAYEPLYALDDGVPVARVGSVRLPFRTRREVLTVCGIADVVTRPDALRRGYATALLDETHRRARAQGARWSFLWTRRSWGAHRAYQRLGYRDVYSPPLALRKIPAVSRPSRLPSRFSWRRATVRDAARMEELLHEATKHRLGFVPRSARSFEVRFRAGWRRPRDFCILTERRAPVGYASVVTSRFDVISREAVVSRPSLGPLLLDQFEAHARGRWLAFGQTTFVQDQATEFRRRGFELLGSNHGVLMASPLGRRPSGEVAEVRRTFLDRRLSLHGGDMF